MVAKLILEVHQLESEDKPRVALQSNPLISIWKLLIKSSQFPGISILFDLRFNLSCRTLPNAFDISRNIVWVSDGGKR